MTYSVDKKQFASKIGKITKSVTAMRDDIQDALYASVFMHLKDNSGGTSPMQQVLDAVGGAAHRQGISTWLETFAPVRFVKEKVLLHKENWKLIDREKALADFDAFMQSIGVNEEGKKWYQIAKEHNTTPSIFNAESRVNSLIRALEGHEYGTLARYISEAVDNYNAAQGLANAAIAKAAAEKSGSIEGEAKEVEVLAIEVTQ
jgi:hypothetical protein